MRKNATFREVAFVALLFGLTLGFVIYIFSGQKNMQTKPTVEDNVNLFRSSQNWNMNQQIPDELQTSPQYPLMLGVDGRFPDTIRRFRGFKRLDYDIRYPHSNASEISNPVVNGLKAFDYPFRREYGYWHQHAWGPHDWAGGGIHSLYGLEPTSIDPDDCQIYQFEGLTLDRVRRNEGYADRRPISGFVIHFKNGSDTPTVKFMGRSIGDNSLSALFQIQCLGPKVTSDLGWDFYERKLEDTLGAKIDWVGIGTTGRFLYLSHRGKGSTYGIDPDSQGNTWVFDVPWKAKRGMLAGHDGTDYHTLDEPESEFPNVHNGFMVPGAKRLRCKIAGTRGFQWLHTPAMDTSIDGAVKDEGWADSAQPENITEHEPLNLFRLRLRLVNYSTGFVSPMSEPLAFAIGVDGEGVKISWVPGTQYSGSGTDAGAVRIAYNYAEEWDHLMKSFFGISYETTSNVAPDRIQLEGLYNTRIQIWVTQSVPWDNYSGGGGYYYLDQEIPVVHRHMGYLDPIFSPSYHYVYIWPGWMGEEHLGSDLIGLKIPSKSNAALAVSDIYIPEADDVGELDPTDVLGSASGCLLSTSDGGEVSNAEGDNVRGDIKISPPWKSYPAGWLETTVPKFRHVVFPKGLTPPKFVNVGDLVFYVGQNRLVRIARDGSSILADDIDISGGVNRDSVAGIGKGIILVTSTGLQELNPVSLDLQTIDLVQRIITERWQKYVLEGRIMSGYDPQLKAVFIAPRRAYTSTEWFRSEALVIWTSTGKVTMLSDIYWTGMTRGVEPRTGKEHLFFIDPAMNITYPDASLSDEGIATMTGINTPVDPEFTSTGWQRNAVVWTLTVLDSAFDAGATIVIDGIPLEEGEANSWTQGETTSNVAASIRSAIQTMRTADYASCKVSSVYDVTRVANVLTITTFIEGNFSDSYNYIDLIGITDAQLTITQTTLGETAVGDPLEAGGAHQGAITDISGTVTKIVTDSTLHVSNEGSNLDLYARYDPDRYAFKPEWYPLQPTSTALIGSQVYFFRLVDDDEGVSRATLVADVRISTNTQQTFSYLESEVVYHNEVTSVLVGDTYCLSPVVMQVVYAPLVTDNFAGSGINVSGAIESLGVFLRNRKGQAKSTSTPLPLTALQSALHLGVASSSNLTDRPIGQALTPEVSIPVLRRLDSSDGTEGALLWSETEMDVITAGINRKGNNLFPVVTHYGTNYQFDLIALLGVVSREGTTSGERPEGM